MKWLVSTVGASLVLCCVCLYAAFGQVEPKLTDGVLRVGAPPSVPNALRRYHLNVTQDDGRNLTLVLVDTHTGHCWVNPNGRGWNDWGSPVKR